MQSICSTWDLIRVGPEQHLSLIQFSHILWFMMWPFEDSTQGPCMMRSLQPGWLVTWNILSPAWAPINFWFTVFWWFFPSLMLFHYTDMQISIQTSLEESILPSRKIYRALSLGCSLFSSTLLWKISPDWSPWETVVF